MSASRIVLVSPYDLWTPGGVQGQVRAMATGLARRGRQVCIVAPGTMPRDEELVADGVDVVGVGRVLRMPANGSVAPISLSFAQSRLLARIMVEVPGSIGHLHEPVTPVLGWSTLHQHRVGLVGTFHRSGIDPLYRLAAPLLRRLVDELDACAAVSSSAAETAASTLNVDPEVLFNGIDVEAHQAADPWPSEGRTVLFLGRDEQRKGRSVLLEAAGSMSEDVTIWVTGDPTAVAPGGAQVRFLGVIDESEKRRRLAGADVLCAPSLGGESFGMVLLEAMASSTAVVASDIDGYRQALGGHGWLSAPGDAAALAASIERALLSSTEAGKAAALEHAREWSIGALLDRYEPLYELAEAAAARRARH